MNTDNMSILGLTIDYGPYGWLEDYDPDWTPNTTDAEGRRYRFRNQPDIAMWNLVQLGNALYPLIEDIAPMELVLNSYSQQFDNQFPVLQQQKLGLQAEYDSDFQDELISLLTASETDMTIFYRNLANVVKKIVLMKHSLKLPLRSINLIKLYRHYKRVGCIGWNCIWRKLKQKLVQMKNENKP
jgi:serine/tyrosine/threonine adenylyltransferase